MLLSDIVTKAITVIAETNILAKIYQAKSVLYQCGVIDINQSQDIVASVRRKTPGRTQKP